MAAVLAGGDGAALSHGSAAALWEIGTEHRGQIDISVLRRCEMRRPGMRIRGRPSMPAQDIVFRDDIPVTSPARTLVDQATELAPVALERAVNNADKRDLIDPETLREELERITGEPGVRPLRQMLDALSFRLSDPSPNPTPDHQRLPVRGGRRAGGVRLRELGGKQFKDAGSPNSSAIRATEDAEMRRRQVLSGVRTQPPPTP